MVDTVNIETNYEHRPVANITALKAINTTSILDGVIITISGLGTWQFIKASTATGDDITVVTPTAGGGRWIKQTIIEPDGTIKLLKNLNANSFTVTGLATPSALTDAATVGWVLGLPGVGEMQIQTFAAASGGETTQTITLFTPEAATVNKSFLFINGLQQTYTTHYTISGQTITYTTALTAGDIVTILCNVSPSGWTLSDDSKLGGPSPSSTIALSQKAIYNNTISSYSLFSTLSGCTGDGTNQIAMPSVSQIDIGSAYNPSTGLYTAAENQVVKGFAQIQLSDINSAVHRSIVIWFQKNTGAGNAIEVYNNDVPANNTSFSGSFALPPIALSAGDTLSFQFSVSGTSKVIDLTHCLVCFERVRAV